MTLRAVCYARVSSAGQRDRDTIASQLRVLPEYVTRQGWELVRPVTAYVDDGRSAKSGRLEARTGLAALLRDAALGLFEVVVVVDIDRLTRAEDLAERGLILGALQHAGVQVASAMGGELMDLNSDHGDLIASLKAYVAAADNRKRAERVRQGKISLAARGGKVGGRGPYGLIYTKPARWAIDPLRGPIVIEVFERVAAGESCQAIATDLALRGVPAPGRSWTKGRIHDMIHSTTPIGEYVTHHGTRTTTTVPALVSVELWQRAAAALVANRTRGLRRTRHVYLLEGLALCGACGARMRIRSAILRRGKVEPARYLCSARVPWTPLALRTTTERCDAPMVPTAEADARAWAAITAELADPMLPAELALERRGIASDARDWETDAKGYRDHVTRLDKVEGALLLRFRRGAISESALDKELADLRRERAAVRAQLATAERARGATISAQARLQQASVLVDAIRAKSAAATPEERREIAAALIDPGGVTFVGTALRIELFVERPATEDAGSIVDASFSAAGHESYLRIRVVA